MPLCGTLTFSPPKNKYFALQHMNMFALKHRFDFIVYLLEEFTFKM